MLSLWVSLRVMISVFLKMIVGCLLMIKTSSLIVFFLLRVIWRAIVYLNSLILRIQVLLFENVWVFNRLVDKLPCWFLFWIALWVYTLLFVIDQVWWLVVLNERICTQHRKNRMLKLVCKIKLLLRIVLALMKSPGLFPIRIPPFMTWITLLMREWTLPLLRAFPWWLIQRNTIVLFLCHSNVLIVPITQTFFERRLRLGWSSIQIKISWLNSSRILNVDRCQGLKLIQDLNFA